MKTIAIIQQKGGVGKTTLVINLAMYFATEMGKQVAVVDADSQGSLTEFVELLDGVELIAVQEFLDPKFSPKGIDIIFVDTSPRNDVNLSAIISLSDFCLLPVRPGYLDLSAMKATEQIVTESVALMGSAIVLTQVQHRNALNRDADELLTRFTIPVLNTRITQRVAYQRSMYTNGVFGSTDEKAKEEIENLALEIFEKL